MTPETLSPDRMDRRAALKWMLAAAASAPLLEGAALAATPSARGYGTDVDLTKTYQPGDCWPLTFTDAQRATAAVLCGVIIPADDKGPGAAAVKVHDFIDEWVSAPYPGHDADRSLILEGLKWIEDEAQKRFSNSFGSLIARQQNAICDDICLESAAKPEFRRPARFFRRFRDLTAGGYYTTPEGMKDIGYTGNVPLETFPAPTPAALKHLGLA